MCPCEAKRWIYVYWISNQSIITYEHIYWISNKSIIKHVHFFGSDKFESIKSRALPLSTCVSQYKNRASMNYGRKQNRCNVYIQNDRIKHNARWFARYTLTTINNFTGIRFLSLTNLQSTPSTSLFCGNKDIQTNLTKWRFCSINLQRFIQSS